MGAANEIPWWKRTAVYQRVKVYRREKRPGIELAAEGIIAASPERVRRVLVDYPSHRKWQKHPKSTVSDSMPPRPGCRKGGVIRLRVAFAQSPFM